MAMSIGGVAIPDDERPDAGSYEFWRERRIVSHPALGLIGSVQQDMGTDPLRFTQHMTLSQATMTALQALYDASAGPHAYIETELPEPFLTGFDVVMQRPRVSLSENNRGLPWFDVTISFEEVVA